MDAKMKKLSRLRSLMKDRRSELPRGDGALRCRRRSGDALDKSGAMDSMEPKGISKFKSWMRGWRGESEMNERLEGLGGEDAVVARAMSPVKNETTRNSEHLIVFLESLYARDADVDAQNERRHFAWQRITFGRAGVTLRDDLPDSSRRWTKNHS